MELICKDVRKSFGNVKALNNATFSVKSGEVRALVGGNGSGKSTLAKILGGIIVVDGGEITLDGEAYKVDSPISAKRKGVVITSQELSLFRNLSIIQNICICNMDIKKTGSLDTNLMEQKTREVLRVIGKESLINKRIGSLPANEQYLLELAKALIQKPKVLIIDEITSALYKSDVAAVSKILEDLKASGVIILFISHRLNEVLTMCDSVSILRNGDMIGTYEKSELDENQLISLMSGRDITEYKPKHFEVDEASSEVILNTGKIHLNAFGKDVELSVAKGEFVGVAGLDGQGQTTFLRSLFGMNGAVNLELHGEKYAISSPAKAIKHGFAFVSGDREAEGTFKERSITENLNVVKQLVLNQKLEDTDEILKANGVKYSDSGDLITSLSGGNQQKVVIGRWTIIDPKLILADDPTKGIDIQARRDVHETFLKLIEKGASVIMISSDDEELVEASKMMPLSRIIVMYEGEIVQTLRGKDITLENIASHSAGKSAGEVKQA